jgi:hypothetical protein
MTLPAEKLVTIIRAFSHELSTVIESYERYVLKYVGDAVIAFFPYGFNRYLTCDKSVECGKSMVMVLGEGINPILRKAVQSLHLKLKGWNRQTKFSSEVYGHFTGYLYSNDSTAI